MPPPERPLMVEPEELVEPDEPVDPLVACAMAAPPMARAPIAAVVMISFMERLLSARNITNPSRPAMFRPGPGGACLTGGRRCRAVGHNAASGRISAPLAAEGARAEQPAGAAVLLPGEATML